ncbi:PQQ-dependent sugar dehydrogenase [Poriferisphaera corsica]|nr:PQQ-dependent sugar dehydrogenase [Poriferisphaera corsica]
MRNAKLNVCVMGVLLCVWGLGIGAVLRAEVVIESAFPELWFNKPVYLTHVPDGSGKLIVIEQGGGVYVFPNKTYVKKGEMVRMFDGDTKHGQIRADGEQGLLGLAVHPDFKTTREVFLHYSAMNPRRGIVSRFKVGLDWVIDKQSEVLVIEVDQPYANHNGGTITFGPDGYLYVGWGDGGAAGDPKGHGQDRGTLLGSILRIDVDRREGSKGYAVPRDNPFVRLKNVRPEIWAWGIRNPWRFSFDRETGLLWVGDVGQNKYEEVSIVPRGGNMGWNIKEGKHAFKRGRGRGLIDPVWEYGRDEGYSITGGYVYRGQKIKSLYGAYVFADFVSSHVWALQYDEKRGEVKKHVRIGTGHTPASFGEDADGELYICTYGGGIFKFTER